MIILLIEEIEELTLTLKKLCPIYHFTKICGTLKLSKVPLNSTGVYV
jgi:hypothetical protein